MPTDVVILERVWPPRVGSDNLIGQIGGWPNLPSDLLWPRIQFKTGSSASLDFLAQIDLARLPAVSQRALLPAKGTLFFFALSQSHRPLSEFGPEAACVLYYPDDVRAFPRRRPPSDSGWGQGDLNYERTCAAEFRDTDAPLGELFPVCPISARAAIVDTSSTPRRDFTRIDADLPYRVQDALLHINFARNSWREGVLPFSAIRNHFTVAAEYHVKSEKNPPKWMQGKPPQPRPAYVDNALSDTFWSQFEGAYLQWRDHAASLWQHLSALGGASVLDSDQRASVTVLVGRADALRRQVGPYGLQFSSRRESAARMALAPLLVENPAAALMKEDELMAAHPSKSHLWGHRMLGPSNDIQGGMMDGTEPVLLLQLDTDPWGPRLDWWDAGNITFWISAADAAAGRFENARAEIEGH